MPPDYLARGVTPRVWRAQNLQPMMLGAMNPEPLPQLPPAPTPDELYALVYKELKRIALARIGLGDAIRGQRRYAEAESLLLAAYARFEQPKPMTKGWRT